MQHKPCYLLRMPIILPSKYRNIYRKVHMQDSGIASVTCCLSRCATFMFIFCDSKKEYIIAPKWRTHESTHDIYMIGTIRQAKEKRKKQLTLLTWSLANQKKFIMVNEWSIIYVVAHSKKLFMKANSIPWLDYSTYVKDLLCLSSYRVHNRHKRATLKSFSISFHKRSMITQ